MSPVPPGSSLRAPTAPASPACHRRPRQATTRVHGGMSGAIAPPALALSTPEIVASDTAQHSS
ncbi:hypothetical protein C2E23DRAFT_806123 [Lenzites betulinus]|nr:hypothetical protein C2E23DRAFT_806123 [Lenzites betulinus]